MPSPILLSLQPAKEQQDKLTVLRTSAKWLLHKAPVSVRECYHFHARRKRGLDGHTHSLLLCSGESNKLSVIKLSSVLFFFSFNKKLFSLYFFCSWTYIKDQDMRIVDYVLSSVSLYQICLSKFFFTSLLSQFIIRACSFMTKW